MLSLPTPQTPLPTFPHHLNHHHHPTPHLNRSPNNNHHQNPTKPHTHPRTTPLSQLRHDENLLRHRKALIRHYGTTWIRPPGVPKTRAAMVEEQLEREEQELVAARETAMLEAQEAAAAEEGNAGTMMDVDAAVGTPATRFVPEVAGMGMEGVEAIDLDDEVPEAGSLGGWESSDDDDDNSTTSENSSSAAVRDENGARAEEAEDVNVAISPDLPALRLRGAADDEGEGDYDVPGMLEGSTPSSFQQPSPHPSQQQQQRRAPPPPPSAHARMQTPAARDLDDDVPEAGSYQHTDTEAEDESSFEEAGSSFLGGHRGRGMFGSPLAG
ncbi:hypothetical protein Q9189_007983, partial [Teloschistes chrysophthalmus]